MRDHSLIVSRLWGYRGQTIVRDADALHLYKTAGGARFPVGLESIDEKTRKPIRKGATRTTDREVIRLTRQHGILSIQHVALATSSEHPLTAASKTVAKLVPVAVKKAFFLPLRTDP